jgi:hypothetical protein
VNDGPPSVTVGSKVAAPAEVQQRSVAIPNGMQIMLSQAAKLLPPAPLPPLGVAPPSRPMLPPTQTTVIVAATDAIERVNGFLGISSDIGGA